MSDERLELPLFDPPERDSKKEEVDSLFDEAQTASQPSQDPRPREDEVKFDEARTAPQPPTDDPVVVEPIELAPAPRAETGRAEATTDPIPDLEAPTADLSPALSQPAGVGPRLAGGMIDLLVHVTVAGILVGGSSLLDAPVGLRHTLPLASVAAIFSFVYHVIPLAFWGRTPGMAVAGLRTRTLDDEPLSLPQATTHWIALLLTVATAGLGVLLALGGRSLADRVSGSQTLQE